MEHPGSTSASSPQAESASPETPAGQRYCKGCGYDLRALPEPRCPECGRNFDPANPRTFRRSPRRVWVKWIKRAVAMLLVVVLVAGGAWGWMYLGWKEEQQALAKVGKIGLSAPAPIGPPWLIRRLGPAGFVFLRVQHANLYGSDRIDLLALGKLTSLQSLDLGEAIVQDLSPLSTLTDLQELSLYETRVQNLSPLSKLKNLQVLHLNTTWMTDIYPLSELTSLRELWLDDTRVKDISPLSKLASLKKLSLSETPVQDLSPLAKLKGLRLLWLSDQIPAAQVEELRQALPQCAIGQR